MKKRLISLFASLILIVTGVGLVGCSKDNTENFSLSGISSNGGIGAVKDGYLYFIQTPSSVTEYTKELGDKCGIYKAPIDENGQISGDATLVYSCLAGNTLGQIYIFGDYIYFTTPSSGRNSSGAVMSDHTTFGRVKTDGTDYQKIYTGVTKSITSYAYYLTTKEDVTELYLTLLEGEELKSVEVSSGDEEVIDEGVTSVVFSETQGTASKTDGYIYYTKNPEKDYITQSGTNVYRAQPSGETELISAGTDVTLLAIKNGYLYFTQGTIVYRTTYGNELGTQNVVSYKTYTEFILTEDGGIVVEDSTTKSVCYYNWSSGSIVAGELLDSTTHDMMLIAKGYVYFLTSKDAIVRVPFNTTNGAVAQKEQTVSSDTTYDAGEYLKYEVISNTLYYYVKLVETDDAGNETTSYVLRSVNLAAL